MERERVISAHARIVQPFLKEAFKEGAHRIKPEHLTEDQWIRRKQIGILYGLTPADLEDLKSAYGLNSRERVRQIYRDCLTDFWNNGSKEVQERHSLEDVLAARKPWSQKSRDKKSLSQGGVSFKIKEQVENGATSIKQINANTGIPEKKISRYLSTKLKDLRENVSRKRVSYREVLAHLDKETDDKKIQKLLDGLPYYVMRDRRGKKRSSQFSSLSNLIREAGFRSRDNDPFATSLESAGVPITRKEKVVTGTKPQTYYILLSRHRDRAIQKLREDQSLQGFRR